ncbi:MAG TPA: tRNA (guanosine(37)-N1)-methyltransferase TrmD, partial [bacterium]|nr:tRNA (guanosine(37)-N1)-methyltransferase TrmD [bacterium]
MTFDVLTIFPGFFSGPLEETILKRAREKGLLDVHLTDIRAFATDKHAKTDDVPFGGGPGMVMKPEPVVAAIEAARAAGATRVVLLDPGGARFDQAAARRLAGEKRVALVCGRYEGFDDRIRAFADEELSVGDVVLSGGEPAAL